MRNNFSFKKLFTLVELLIVIVVLGILAAIIIPNIASFSDEAKQTRLVADLRNTQTAVDNYHLKVGEYPTVDGKKPVFMNEPIVWDKLVHDYLRKEPKLEKDQTVYVDPYGSVTLGYNSHAYFLRWLKDSPFIVSNPSDPAYNQFSIKPPAGSVMFNYNTKTKKFETYDGKNRILTLSTATTGDALIEAYLATGDQVFLDRAKLIGNYLMTITYEDDIYFKSVTKIAPMTEFNGAEWKTDYSTSYSNSMAVSSHFLIELGKHTGNTAYSDTGIALADALIMGQEELKYDPTNPDDSSDYNQIAGAIPEQLTSGASYQTSMGGVSWLMFPTDMGSMLYDASVSAYNKTGDKKYLKLKDDYFSFLEKSFTDLNGLSPEGYAYEYIYNEEDASKNHTFYGVNVNQKNGNLVGSNQPFTTDQQFYLVLGLIKQNSPSANKMYEKAAQLQDGNLFHGQYNPNGTPDTTSPDIVMEIINTALFLEMSKYKNPELAKSLEMTMIETMFKDEGNSTVDASQSWTTDKEQGYIIEDLASAYFPKSILFQRSFDNVIYK